MTVVFWLIVSQCGYGMMSAKAKGVVMVPEYYPLDSAIVYYVDSVLHCPDYSGEQVFLYCGKWPNGSPTLCIYEATLPYNGIKKDFTCGYIKIGEKIVYIRNTPDVDMLFQNSYGEYWPFAYDPIPPFIHITGENPEWYFGWRNGVMVYLGSNLKPPFYEDPRVPLFLDPDSVKEE